MEKEKKLFWYNIVISTSLFIIIMLVLNISFNSKLSEQQAYYDSEIEKLSIMLNKDMEVLQNLITNVDAGNKKRSKELIDLIEDIEAESKESIEKAKSELESEIASIETLNTDFSKVAQEALKSVVSVLTDKGQGSGAIISSDGRIVTNYHVIEGVGVINVLTYGKSIYKAHVVDYDASVDIAVLEIDTNETFERLRFGDSDDVNIGESVLALGNPLGLDFTVTQGIVSARRMASNDIEYLQIDVPINPGNSGGPIVDSKGEIIGIANFRIKGAEGIGFAIPSNTVEDVI